MRSRFCLILTCLLAAAGIHVAVAQQAETKQADSGIVSAPLTANDKLDTAWSQLENSLNAGHADTRIAAVDALSLLGGIPRAEKLIHTAMKDRDIDIQLAAIVAAGEMARSDGPQNGFQNELRSLLDGSDPRVVYTAASTLWKLNDPSGEDILEAVAQGERSADYSFWKSSRHSASRQLHSPAALAKIGATQGAMMLVPPIGIGMGAYNYLKGSGGPSPQVTAITQIGHEHTSTVQASLIAATTTKDLGAKLAAVEALASFQGDAVRDALEPLMSDSKENLRLTATAAYIRVASGPRIDPVLAAKAAAKKKRRAP